MKIKFNGWQRLWVVLSAMYLPIVIVFTSISWPTEKQIENSWVYSLIDSTKDPSDNTDQIREAYKDIPDKELIKRINAKYETKPEYKEILNTTNLRYQKEIQAIATAHFKTIGLALIAWVLPVGTAYLMGLAVGWIYKGFKEK